MIASITRSHCANSSSVTVAFTNGAYFSIFCGSAPRVALLKATSSSTFCTPPASALGMASVMVTAMSRRTEAAAIPAPMMPAPKTPTLVIGCGLTLASVTPVSFLLRSVRKKMFNSARLIGEPNRSANPSASAAPAASMSPPAEPIITSRAAIGAGYCPLVCCWM